MKTKLLAALTISGMVALSACATSPAAQPQADDQTNPATLLATEIAEEETEVEDFCYIGLSDEVIRTSFASLSGLITEKYEIDDDTYAILIETEEGGMTTFIVDHLTAQLFDGDLETGMSITGFFDTNLPTPMIYPPQHHARVIISDSPYAVYVDSFGEGFNAKSNPKQFEARPETGIVFQDGTEFTGELSEIYNRTMAVFFIEENIVPGEAIPAAKIVVLFERAVAPIHYLSEEELAMIDFGTDEVVEDVADWGGGLQLSPEDLEMIWSSMFDPETVQIYVNGEAIEAATPFINRENGGIMLPVGAIAEALGYTVVGEGADIIVGQGITFTVGEDSYFRGRMAPMQLGAAPELVDDTLFVPMGFFDQILSAGAYISDGNIYVVTITE